MNDDKMDKVMSEFLVNTCFSMYSLKVSSTSEEYYVKNDDFTFYYCKCGIINAYFLFDRDVSIEDIINTKNELKSINN